MGGKAGGGGGTEKKGRVAEGEGGGENRRGTGRAKQLWGGTGSGGESVGEGDNIPHPISLYTALDPFRI